MGPISKYKRLIIEISLLCLGAVYFYIVIHVAVGHHFDIQEVDSANFEQWASEHHPILIDLRESHEITRFPLEYQPLIHLPFSWIMERLDQVQIPDQKPVLLVCSDGNRARLVASLLAERGIQTYYLNFGINHLSFTGIASK
ncbi:MAG: hypothetical protein Kow0042_06690 [Calditrichia bacterium]